VAANWSKEKKRKLRKKMPQLGKWV